MKKWANIGNMIPIVAQNAVTATKGTILRSTILYPEVNVT